jgi:hypothetical protein
VSTSNEKKTRSVEEQVPGGWSNGKMVKLREEEVGLPSFTGGELGQSSHVIGQ